MVTPIANGMIPGAIRSFDNNGPGRRSSGAHSPISWAPDDGSILKGTWTQQHENDRVTKVMMHFSRLGNFMGNLHPIGSLYNDVVDLGQAERTQQLLIDTFTKRGIEVFLVDDMMRAGIQADMRQRVRLEKFAKDILTYQLDAASDTSLLTRGELRLLSNEYKEAALRKMEVEQLIDIVLTRPVITLVKSSINHALATEYVSFQPLTNLIFTRDIAINTHSGLVLGRPNSEQRRPEIPIIEEALSKLQIPVLASIPAPGVLEGGDFLPMGENLCFLGIGARTNRFAAHYLMSQDLLGTDCVAVVRDIFDRSQERMHLGFILNFISDNCVIMLESCMGDSSPRRRLVDEWRRTDSLPPETMANGVSNGGDGPGGPYSCCVQNVELSEYLRLRGFHVIPMPDRTECYPCHVLNLGNGHILVEDAEMARILAEDEVFDGTIEVVGGIGEDGRQHNIMWVGGIHCVVQVLEREPRENRRQPIPVARSNSTLADVGQISLAVNGSPQNGKGGPAVDGHQGLPARPKPGLRSPEMSEADSELYGHGMVVPDNTATSQSTNSVLMVAPTAFYQNLETLVDNYFMQGDLNMTKQEIQAAALQEYAVFHQVLTQAGVRILLWDYEAYHDTPDATFVNNWFSTHPPQSIRDPTTGELNQESVLITYPMKAENRRRERRPDIMQELSRLYPVVVDFHDEHETLNQFCESTGVLIFDRPHRRVFANISERCHEQALNDWCARYGYEKVAFHSCDDQGRSIYHTNVMMYVGTELIIAAVETIRDSKERAMFIEEATKHHTLVAITWEQVMKFCGNILEVLNGADEPCLVMSDQAYNAFTKEQMDVITRFYPDDGHILHADISTVERVGGGGVRCCIGELF
eukprot:Clim_evm7s39 gene=Clim_evmTU7s39